MSSIIDFLVLLFFTLTTLNCSISSCWAVPLVNIFQWQPSISTKCILESRNLLRPNGKLQSTMPYYPLLEKINVQFSFSAP